MALNRPVIDFMESLGTEVLHIYVGARRKHFCVHILLLRDKAPDLWHQMRRPLRGEYYFGWEYQTSFSMLVEWLYRDKIAAPSQHRTDEDARAEIEAYIYLTYLARMYNIGGLPDAAVENLGVCYLVNNIFPSLAEMRLVFNYCDTFSFIGRYMVHMFRELLVCYPEYDPITLRDTADMSSLDMWAFAREYEEVGRYVFESVRAGRLAFVRPRHQLICFYHQHGPDAACASRGMAFEDRARDIKQEEEEEGDGDALQEAVIETTSTLPHFRSGLTQTVSSCDLPNGA